MSKALDLMKSYNPGPSITEIPPGNAYLVSTSFLTSCVSLLAALDSDGLDCWHENNLELDA